MMRVFSVLLILAAACEARVEVPEEPVPAPGPRESPEGAVAYIIYPENGDVLTGETVHVVFGLEGMGVAPAGVDMEGTGHHHLLVDTTVEDMTVPIPADSNHFHFGMGQTETVLQLSPGPHTLQLLLGDYAHIPHDPPVQSHVVNITVE